MKNNVSLLVVEDSPTQAMEIQYFLEQNGYNVLIAEDGEQAFGMLSDFRPDIIISDIVMPRMNGYELCEKVKKNDELKDIPVILLTSLSEPEDVINGLVCGANNFIIKPFDKKVMLSRIKYTIINMEMRKCVTSQVGVKIFFREKEYFLSSERIQMIDLLLSTYEAAIQKNNDFKKANLELEQIKDELEKRVLERTHELSKSNLYLQKEIEERKSIEKALRRSENELAIKNHISRVFITSPDDEVFKDLLDIVLKALISKYGILGYIDEDGALVCPSMTKDIWEECKVHDKDIRFPRKSWTGIWGQSLMEGKSLYSNQPSQVPEGHIQITRTLSVPIIYNGEVIGNLLVGNKETDYDKSDVRLMEAIASHLAPLLNARLQRDKQIKKRQSIEDQLRQAQKMESVGRLAGGVAHDYNNVLSVIMGFTELAMEEKDLTEPLRVDLKEILKAAKRATDITRQLLAFARKQTIAPKVLDLNKSVDSMIKMLRRLIGEDIDLSWCPGAAMWPIKMDPSQIDQILANLCVNARDAISGVGKVSIETKKVSFDAIYCAEHHGFIPGEFVMLAVSDNGCGIDKKILDNIFEPFFTTKGLDKGTGLGLSTVYGIVKQNNGFINVYSEPGIGTTVKIYLARHKGNAVEIQMENREEIMAGHGEIVLIVEDDRSILKLARQMLDGLGYIVLTQNTSAGAIRLAEEYTGKIDLLLTDVIMPEMNGLELANSLQSIYPNLKCIFMSGYTSNAIARHGVLDEGVNFIQKPFSKKDLARIVRKVIDE
ncbi:His Kinase A (phospho-acceptor) domain-containing protein [Desulfocicer vacuolatum DSM 3385]|uniref:histidine kinase n=1 Tax=Desulfocicer vacuolatum DSM 3385 TaxID=1121400 RepID=A0A1W1YT12_9BACT|nr:response regulator [Desulfocicer vacuolatum]SMC39276.1 His Kinase A (phospho-acceptor) domain-containing protein [Desulfocicer vacuolatum DSM 3385]